MDGENKEGKKKLGAGRAIGSLVQRRRAELREFEEIARAKEEALRRERKLRAEALKEVERRERRLASEQRKDNERRLKFALGQLVLVKLRAFPGSPLQFGADDLRLLEEKDRIRLAQALGDDPPPAPDLGRNGSDEEHRDKDPDLEV